MRLIDADNLNFEGQNYNKSQMKAILDFLDNQPTAFDVDKVVKQLEETREKDIPRINNTTTTRDEKVYKLAMSYAIEVVKAGGIDNVHK